MIEGQALRPTPTSTAIASRPPANLAGVGRQELHHAMAPPVTKRKIGRPARERDSSMAQAPASTAAQQIQRIHAAKLQQAALTITGIVMQKYIERLFGWKRVPVG